VVEAVQNTNPVIVEGHKLGIELWAVKLAFTKAYQIIMAWRDEQKHHKPLGNSFFAPYNA